MLIIIRGVPGSGKSTIAKEYVERGYQHFEADMYFLDNDGNYKFDTYKLRDAHAWCMAMTFHTLLEGKNVVVSNTFVKRWEFQPYIDFCNDNNIPYGIIVAGGSYFNIHGVPDEVVKRMRRNWED